MEKKVSYGIGIAFAGLLFSGLLLWAAGEKTFVSADDALSALNRGNKRFVLMKTIKPRQTAERRSELTKGQNPFAIIIGCSDSRVPPEILFDQGLGDLFIVRTAGNVIDDVALGSVEYGVEHLGCRLIVVLGHQKCGAVDATIKQFKAGGVQESADPGSSSREFISVLVAAIMPSVKKASRLEGELFGNAIHVNAFEMARKLERSKIVTEAGEKEGLRIVCGYYALDTGKVDFYLKDVAGDPYGK